MFLFTSCKPREKRLNDVDALWESLKNEVDVVYEIENFGYGMREFAIYDNNGYILQFGQPVETIAH